MNLETTRIFKSLTGKSEQMIEITGSVLERLKAEILSIAKDVIDVCEENDISYHLTGGSALGAVRHKGFIPWDDDMDLDMERKDVERFLEKFSEKHGDKYWIHTCLSSERFCIPFIQIRKKGTVLRGILDSLEEECGVYIDIAVIENTYNNGLRRKIHGFGSLVLGFIVSCRRFYRDRKYLLSLTDDSEVIRVFKTKIGFGWLLSFMSLRRWTLLYDKWNSKCKDISSVYVSVPTGRNHFFKEMYQREDFCEYTIAEFEGNQWRIPKNYDKYLGHMYGDYMKIPPKASQETHAVLKLDLGE